MNILPQNIREETEEYRLELQEIRMRLNEPTELVLGQQRCRYLSGKTTQSQIDFCINGATRYSPWAASTVARGYITAPGGHRIGICGEAVMKEDRFSGIRNVSSLCIRVARDFPGLCGKDNIGNKNTLILGAPGWGKTTLLRDLARNVAEKRTVSVVDERQELFPDGFCRGRRMDVLTGCPKRVGIDTVLKTMTPDCIAVDEITSREDCDAIVQAFGCGVQLIATAHAAGMEDFRRRKIYAPLLANRVFETCLVLRRDKTFFREEMDAEL